jgi:hypothetical protein
MPRFYFHLQHDDGVVADRLGAVLPDDEAAWYQAFRSARALLSERAEPGWRAAGHFIQVEDEAGRAIVSLPLIEVAELAR